MENKINLIKINFKLHSNKLQDIIKAKRKNKN